MTSGDLVFGINDSGNGPILFAFDSTGAPGGSWTLEGARNRDWEAMAPGPCPPATTSSPGTSCLTIADVGDNKGDRSTLTLYRVEEPAAQQGPARGTLAASSVRIRYQGLKADVEAIYVAGNGDTFLITKRRMTRRDGSPRPALLLRVPATAWETRDVNEIRVVDSLPIVPGSAAGRQVTDASLSRDGRLLAVRTYSEVYLFPVDSLSGRLESGAMWWSCPIDHLHQRMGEGLAWWWDNRTLLLATEGRHAPFRLIRCPSPMDS